MNAWYWELEQLAQGPDYAFALLCRDGYAPFQVAEQCMVAAYFKSEANSFETPRKQDTYVHPDNENDIANFIEVEHDGIFIWRYGGGLARGAEAELLFVLRVMLAAEDNVVEWRIFDEGVNASMEKTGTSKEELFAYLGLTWTEFEMLLRMQ